METNKNKFIGTLLIIIVLLVASFSIGRCSGKSEDVKTIKVPVTIPSVKGESKIVIKPVPFEVIKDNYVYKDSIVYQENQEMITRFQNMKSEIDKLNAYQSSITLNKYNIPYEDDFIKTNALITTRGEVLSFQQLYEIKERTVIADVELPKEKSFLGVKDVYVGGGISNNVDLTKFNFEAGIGLGLKNGNIVEAAYDINKNIHVRYKFKL